MLIPGLHNSGNGYGFMLAVVNTGNGDATTRPPDPAAGTDGTVGDSPANLAPQRRVVLALVDGLDRDRVKHNPDDRRADAWTPPDSPQGAA